VPPVPASPRLGRTEEEDEGIGRGRFKSVGAEAL
jgi:hypothetical protein